MGQQPGMQPELFPRSGDRDGTAPLDALGVDSLTFIEFMFKVEDEFGVKVSDEDLRQIKCLADLERHAPPPRGATSKPASTENLDEDVPF